MGMWNVHLYGVTLALALALLVSTARAGDVGLATVSTMSVGGGLQLAEHLCRDPESSRCTDSGTILRGNAQVLRLMPAENVSPWPIVMVHGLGLTGNMYLTTADGKEGWGLHTARAGIATYLVTLPSVVASGMDGGPFNASVTGAAAPSDQPGLATWVPEGFWTSFGYGPGYPELYPGVQFALEDLEGLMAGVSPYIEPVSGPGLGANQAMDGAALAALLEKVGPAVIVTHSLSGPVGFRVATERPDLVRAIVTIEPARGCPDDFAESDIPVLALFGDHLDARSMFQRAAAACSELASAQRERGIASRSVVLADAGMPGHTHMLPVDRSSERVARYVIDWLQNLR